MKRTFRAVFQKDGKWWIGFSSDVPEANGQGKTLEKCRQNLIEAIKLVLDVREEDVLKTVSAKAVREMLVVE